ncbi:MAG: heavy-metal-associated domain-containing protein [Bacteroidaceae bacterium]|nr:heavy-metal-associated domain-containing protein [Bacteroidaceae bacterium]
MKKTLTLVVAALMCCTTAFAKDLKVLVVKTSPEIHCEKCEQKIKGNVRFTAGVKRIETDLTTKQVAVTYDADKTDTKTLLAAFKKIGFDATVVSDGKAEGKASKKVPVDGTTGASQQKK